MEKFRIPIEAPLLLKSIVLLLFIPHFFALQPNHLYPISRRYVICSSKQFLSTHETSSCFSSVRHRDNWYKGLTGCHQPISSTSSLYAKIMDNDDSLPLSDDDGPNNETKKKFHWWKPTLAIALPAWIGMMADPLLSLMDTGFVGRLGSTELAALGACTSIFHLAFHAFRATTTATTSLVASAETKEEKQQIIRLSLALGLIMGWSVFGILLRFGSGCLSCMGVSRGMGGTSSTLYPPAIAYLTTRSWAAPAVLGLTVAEGAFRGYGDTKIPLVASVVAAMINLVLDPMFMFKPFHFGVKGAAAATALSQYGAFGIYLYFLIKRKMLPRRVRLHDTSNDSEVKNEIINKKKSSKINSRKVILTILGANFAMMTKQASLLLGWAYATAKATRLGKEHVAAHQVALSFWLVFNLLLDGAAVAGQVLMSQSLKVKRKVQSLTKYMVKLATIQGLLATFLVLFLGQWVPTTFTNDLSIRTHLSSLIPHLAYQQILISITLVMESLAAGGKQFSILAWGTTIATIFSAFQIRISTSVEQIWSHGIVALFVGRLITASIGTARSNGWFMKQTHNNENMKLESSTNQ